MTIQARGRGASNLVERRLGNVTERMTINANDVTLALFLPGHRRY